MEVRDVTIKYWNLYFRILFCAFEGKKIALLIRLFANLNKYQDLCRKRLSDEFLLLNVYWDQYPLFYNVETKVVRRHM